MAKAREQREMLYERRASSNVEALVTGLLVDGKLDRVVIDRLRQYRGEKSWLSSIEYQIPTATQSKLIVEAVHAYATSHSES